MNPKLIEAVKNALAASVDIYVGANIEDFLTALREQGVELTIPHNSKGDAIDCKNTPWGMVSEALDGEPLTHRVNSEIYGLCDGTHVVVPVEPSDEVFNEYLRKINTGCAEWQAMIQASQQE